MPYLFPGADKIVHAGLYAVLGAGLGYGRVRSIEPPRHGILILVGVLYAVTDEFHQYFVPGRSPDWADWIADVAGLMCGYLLIVNLFSSSARHGVDASR